MTIKDLFRLIIKLFALYFLVATVFSAVPELITFVTRGDWKGFLWIGAMLALLAAIFLSLLFNPDRLIEMMRLEQGFDSTQISFAQLDDRILIKVGCILLGGFLVSGSISPVLLQTYYVFKGDGFNSGREYILRLIGSIINIGIGYLLITNYNRVTNFLLMRKGD